MDPANVFYWVGDDSPSFNFYTASEHQQFTDSLYSNRQKPVWLLFDRRNLDKIRQAGYIINLNYPAADYEVSKLDLKFVNPSSRNKNLKELIVGEITGKQ